MVLKSVGFDFIKLDAVSCQYRRPARRYRTPADVGSHSPPGQTAEDKITIVGLRKFINEGIAHMIRFIHSKFGS